MAKLIQITDGFSNETIAAPLSLFQGSLINGQIAVSVASNNLTVVIKGLDGNNPSATNPVYIRIGNAVRAITGALSVTKNAGTNWCNSGGAELATKEIDYFVYLGWRAASSAVVVGFARVPYARVFSELSTTTTDEKHGAFSTAPASTDDICVIGRFAATLSAGAGYTWTVPTFTTVNLIQRPIFETRRLIWAPAFGGFSVTPTHTSSYKVVGDLLWMTSNTGGNGTSNATTFTMSLPFKAGISSFNLFNTPIKDNGAFSTTLGHAECTAGSITLSLFKSWFEGAWTNTGAKDAYMPSFLMALR